MICWVINSETACAKPLAAMIRTLGLNLIGEPDDLGKQISFVFRLSEHPPDHLLMRESASNRIAAGK